MSEPVGATREPIARTHRSGGANETRTVAAPDRPTEGLAAAFSADPLSEASCDGDFDVAVVGAGPVGCVAALAHARAGERVVLIEANPRAMERLAGEWLHPRGVEILRVLGVELDAEDAAGEPYESGHGFVVHPEDGSPPIVLPYADGRRGLSLEHGTLVRRLREAASTDANVVYLPGARLVGLEEQSVRLERARRGGELRVKAGRVVGADGRSSLVRRAIGRPDARVTLSRMAGLRLQGATLPREGYGHVLLGGTGPGLAYRIDADHVRLCLDVPLALGTSGEALWDAYAPALPEPLRLPFAAALRRNDVAWALNQTRAREDYGEASRTLVGDAVGFQHPLTAVGMTLGFADAAQRARARSFSRFERSRRWSARVPELLAGVLYEVLSDPGDAATAIRRGIYALWRRSAAERERTMRYLAGEDGQLTRFATTFARVAAPALVGLVFRALRTGDLRRAGRGIRDLGVRARWLVSGALFGPRARGKAAERERVRAAAQTASPDATPGIARAAEALAREQHADGSFEGEVVWCPMLAAQYVLFCEAMGIGVPKDRAAGLLRHFERTRRPDGLWGLHELSEPYLFVTTLVYVAARLLGVPADAPLLARAASFIEREGVVAIPSWGKHWLALLGLYDWRGAPPILPELFALPRWLPFHPSKFYCHTRHIYLAMSVLHARRLRAQESERLVAIRDELYPNGMEAIDWDAARRRLRAAELNSPPSLPLRALYRLLAAYDRRAHRGLRRRVLAELEDRIRFDLRTTDHTSLSPVSGLLNILALHATHPEEPELHRALEQLEAWFWHDEENGTRIAGARSASWDTSFALQALRAAGPPAAGVEGVDEAIDRGASFLREQQIRAPSPGYEEAFRLDPAGGFCFASGWHGWPVSDCTAEALEAFEALGPGSLDPEDARNAVRFILRCQNPDGGFGSYEARRSRVGLEWLNPAEMFGESMTEHSYVECTASSLSALAGFRARLEPGDASGPELDRAMGRAERRLRALQRADGSWRGVWGVHFLYGTLFGVRGLVSTGAGPADPALRRARAWVRAHQRDDGGWGEDHRGCVHGRYVKGARSQSIQTAWALLALLEAGEPGDAAIGRGAAWLLDRQEPSGSWPREEPAGLFFRTALLDYELYRTYFPLWALGRYEARRRLRDTWLSPERPLPDAAVPSAAGA